MRKKEKILILILSLTVAVLLLIKMGLKFESPEKEEPVPGFVDNIEQLSQYHNFGGGIQWKMSENGIELKNQKISPQKMHYRDVENVWNKYHVEIAKWCQFYDVPLEIVIATICVESRGNPKVSNGRNHGLMQLMSNTARSALQNDSVNTKWLFVAENSIRAGTAYIHSQRKTTLLDPPKVASAYNAGSLYKTSKNRWKMRQSRGHTDKYVKYFNAAFQFFYQLKNSPHLSYAKYVKKTIS